MTKASSTGAEIDRLIQLLARLPGLGPRSARRAVLHLIKQKENLLAPLSQSLAQAHATIVICQNCGSIDSTDPCTICADPNREERVLTVVEEVGDLWALERAAILKCRYHVLGGVLSPLDGIGPDQLSFGKLEQRVASGQFTEVILAVNATMEGQTTAHFITTLLADYKVKITRLAHGIPVGGELDYLDEGTLEQAVISRGSI